MDLGGFHGRYGAGRRGRREVRSERGGFEI
jgi:hypothetical protein